MEHQTSQCEERQRIADFIALSADYIGVAPPSEQTFARWTSHCVCQQNSTPDRVSH